MADHPAWTTAQEAQLLELIGLQLSASKIGLEMGKTRNAIIGKVHRCGLKLFVAPRRPRDPNYVRPKRSHDRHPSRRLKRQGRRLVTMSPIQMLFHTESVDVPPDFSDHMVPFMDVREGQCRWPIGDPSSPTFRFCGAGQMGHESYCARHCRLAYRKFTPRPDNYRGFRA